MKRYAASNARRESSSRLTCAALVSSPFRRIALAATSLGIVACSEIYVDPSPPFTPPTSVDAGVDPASSKPLGPISVVGHHNSAKRSGTYVEPGLTRDVVATFHVDPLFNAPFTGPVLSQPLFVEKGPGGKGAFYIVTEMNDLTAFDETTGSVLWTKNFGTPADQETTLCSGHGFGFIGVTGTPVIDLDGRTIYFDSVNGADPDDAGIHFIVRHLIHAVSIDDGTERKGWPVDPSTLSSNGHTFDPTVQHQRGALLIEEGMVYVPYGSLGDCGAYHGWLVGIPIADPSKASAYAPPGNAAGIWGPSGVAADEGSIFIATGNSQDPAGEWMGGEAVMRFKAGVPLPAMPDDYYAPDNWHDLDGADLDISGSGVLMIDAPSSIPSELALALGKDGVAYLLDQNNLGGVRGYGDGGTGELFKTQVATKAIVTAAATFTLGDRTFVALDAVSGGVGTACPAGQAGDLIVLEIVGSPPTVQTLWCANNSGHGAPMVTTTDGLSDPIVWATADTSQRLHAYDALTGELLYSGGGDGDVIAGLRRFNTVIAVRDRIIVGADNGLYAFTQ